MKMLCTKCHQHFDNAEVCPDDGSNLVLLPPPMPAPSEDVKPSVEQPPEPKAESPAPLAAPTPAREAVTGGGFNSLFTKLGLKRDGAKTKEDTEANAVLPDEVKSKSWRQVSNLPQKFGTIDAWRVRMDTPSGEVQAWFHRFRIGCLSTSAVYQLIQSQNQRHNFLPKLWQCGTANWGGARADFELSTCATGQSLAKWLAESPPSEQKAMHLARQLATLIGKLDAMGLMAISLDPALLVIDHNSELGLLHAGCLSLAQAAGAAPTYHPAFSRTDLLAKPYAAPELSDSMLLSGRAPLFSAAQLTAVAVWGQAVNYADLRSGNVPFAAIQSPALSSLLMGCLWPSFEKRWGLIDWQAALAENAAQKFAAIPPWASLMPGAAKHAFSFGGQSYWRLDDLLCAAVQPAHWDEACNRIEAILSWAMNETPWEGQAQMIRSALAQGRSADWALVRFNRLVWPTAPVTWRGLDLSDHCADESLSALAQKALQRDPEARALLQRLTQADLRGAFTTH